MFCARIPLNLRKFAAQVKAFKIGIKWQRSKLPVSMAGLKDFEKKKKKVFASQDKHLDSHVIYTVKYLVSAHYHVSAYPPLLD